MSDTPKADKWREELREVGGMDNALVGIPAGGVREIIDALAESERALAAANKRADEARAVAIDEALAVVEKEKITDSDGESMSYRQGYNECSSVLHDELERISTTPPAHVSIPLQLQPDALELMRHAHAANMLEHGDARSAMNSAYMALVGYYKEK